MRNTLVYLYNYEKQALKLVFSYLTVTKMLSLLSKLFETCLRKSILRYRRLIHRYQTKEKVEVEKCINEEDDEEEVVSIYSATAEVATQIIQTVTQSETKEEDEVKEPITQTEEQTTEFGLQNIQGLLAELQEEQKEGDRVEGERVEGDHSPFMRRDCGMLNEIEEKMTSNIAGYDESESGYSVLKTPVAIPMSRVECGKRDIHSFVPLLYSCTKEEKMKIIESAIDHIYIDLLLLFSTHFPRLVGNIEMLKLMTKKQFLSRKCNDSANNKFEFIFKEMPCFTKPFDYTQFLKQVYKNEVSENYTMKEYLFEPKIIYEILRMHTKPLPEEWLTVLAEKCEKMYPMEDIRKGTGAACTCSKWSNVKHRHLPCLGKEEEIEVDFLGPQRHMNDFPFERNDNIHLMIEDEHYLALVDFYNKNIFESDSRNCNKQTESEEEDTWNFHEVDEKKEDEESIYSGLVKKERVQTSVDSVNSTLKNSFIFEVYDYCKYSKHEKYEKLTNIKYRWDTFIIYKIFKDYNEFFKKFIGDDQVEKMSKSEMTKSEEIKEVESSFETRALCNIL